MAKRHMVSLQPRMCHFAYETETLKIPAVSFHPGKNSLKAIESWKEKHKDSSSKQRHFLMCGIEDNLKPKFPATPSHKRSEFKTCLTLAKTPVHTKKFESTKGNTIDFDQLESSNEQDFELLAEEEGVAANSVRKVLILFIIL